MSRIYVRDTTYEKIEIIDLSDVDLDKSGFILRCQPASALPLDITAKIATLDEWKNSGLISNADYKRLADFPDLEDAMTLETAQYDLCEQAVELMLYDGKPYVIEELQNKELWAQIALMMYTRAKLEGLSDPDAAYPESHLDLVRQFIVECVTPPDGSMPTPAEGPQLTGAPGGMPMPEAGPMQMPPGGAPPAPAAPPQVQGPPPGAPIQ